MTEILKDVICCGVEAEIYRNIDVDGKMGVGLLCPTCNNKASHEDEKEAIKAFKKSSNKDGKQTTPRVAPPKKETIKKVNNQLTINAVNMPAVFDSRKKELALITSPILSGDKTAMDRLMDNNTHRYPLTLKGKAWDAIWSTEEGQQSIIKGIEDSLIMAAELGKMGDLVPMGKTCIYVPSVEAFEFALTNGNNAPFSNITIECIYEDDEYKSGRKNGNFFIDFESFGKDRKKVILVAVYGELKKSGIVVGEMYDAERLLEKAALHSKPYANYMKMIKAYEYQKSEGNVQVDANGRESFPYHETAKSDDKYFEKSVQFFKQAESNKQLKSDSKGEYASQMLPGKNGQWEKKTYRYEVEGGTSVTNIFIDELENPYAGADQPEMLRKSAGKSFLGKYAKVRNSEAAMEEVRSSKGAMKQAANMADSQFDDDVIEGEV